jgi:hypothetical protein
MEDYEKLGTFYIGRPYDLAGKRPKEGLTLYDSKDLVTHAVCIGMTGSGKTGLCIGLLEEAAIDHIPAIVVDPKGDMANLLLTFPDLRPDDFYPWINEDDARKKGVSSLEFAQQQADLWRKGLTSWHQSGERILRLRAGVDLLVYTPGSNAGIPVSILESFAAPPAEVLEDGELLRDRITTTTTSLLGLLGIEADPIRSREHILISNLLNASWQNGIDVDLASLIRQIQQPPFTRVGVLDVESFYPSKDRFALSLQLNNLLAAPGFDAWLEGEPLDINRILYTDTGKPKVSVFYIAHLGDSERMFFVALLLNQILGWMRAQAGTNSLRAIFYMDEIFGYFPPVANPPSKTPLLTLLKQARAFGLGVVLTTQNPVDLDYKGLANTGTWFIGRLQTERDKARVLEGLEGAAASTGMRFDRSSMEQTLAGLGKRIFLMNNVHDEAPEIFETRWALSYLRGPLTRAQVKAIMDPIKLARDRQAGTAPGSAPASTSGMAAGTAFMAPPAMVQRQTGQPVLPPDVTQYFAPVRSSQPPAHSLAYSPAVLAAGQMLFSHTKSGVTLKRDVIYRTEMTNDPVPVNWDNAEEIQLQISDLEQAPSGTAEYAELPSVATKARNYGIWAKDFMAWLYRTQSTELLRSPGSKEYSRPGESERDFRIRLQMNSRERRDQQVDALRRKYAPKIAALQEQIRRAQTAVARETEQATQQKMQTAVSVGSTLLGAFMGRKAMSSGTLGRATTSMRGVSRSMKEAKDIERARENVAALQQRLNLLEADFKSEADSLAGKIDPLTEELEHIEIKPAKKDISVQLSALCWMPYWRGPDRQTKSAW